MFAIVEVLSFFMGLWAITTGTLPLLAIFLNRRHYETEGRGVRLLGIVLTYPLPLALSGGWLLRLLFAERALQYAFPFELAVICFAGVTAVLLGRVVLRRRLINDEEEKALRATPDLDAQIGHEAEGALLLALLGGLGITAPVACPLAFKRSQRALHLSAQQTTGDWHHHIANLARDLSILTSSFWVFMVGSIVVLWLLR